MGGAGEEDGGEEEEEEEDEDGDAGEGDGVGAGDETEESSEGEGEVGALPCIQTLCPRGWWPRWSDCASPA